MKRILGLTICSIMAIACFHSAAAFAETGETRYPEDGDFIKSLTFDALSDYAVDGENYAFAEDNTVTVFEKGDIEKFTFESAVTALDCADGVFYCTDGENVYSLPDKEKSDFVIKECEEEFTNKPYHYFLDGTTLKITDYTNDTVHTPEGEFTNLKKYGTIVYAMKDGFVCKFTGETYSIIALDYYDYAVTQDISIGGARTALINYGSLEFVTVAEGAHMTKTDLTDVDGEFFITEETKTAGSEVIALLLCYTGNAAIIAIGDDSYLIHKDNVSVATVNCTVEPEFENATITGNNIYSSPYVIVENPALSNATGAIVEVVNKLEYEGVLGSVFYEVRYSAKNGSIKTGYVADGLLTEYIIEDNKEPATIPDPEYSEKNNTKTVLLVLAVVILILAAVAYLAHVGTGGKKSKKKSKSKEDEE